MLSYLRRHHLGLIAIFFALTGTSYAVATGSIDSREIRNNSIRGKDVRNNILLSRDLRNNSVRSTDVREGTLTGTDVFDAGLTGADVANGSVEGIDVRDGTLGRADIGPNAISNDELGGVSFGSLDGDDRVVASEPRVGAGAPNAQEAVATGWGAAIHNDAGEERTTSVWVVCATR
jgi:hypothetical protein